MNKKRLWHLLFWTGIITCDVLTGIPYWDSDSAKGIIVNYSIVLSLFYYTRFLAMRLLRNSQTIYQQLSVKKYLLLSAIVILFVGIRYLFDYYILIQGYTVTIWYYSFTQLKFALSFIIPAVGIAFAEKRKQVLLVLSKDKSDLEHENKRISSDNERLIIQKEQISSEKWRLLREKTILIKEVNELKRQHQTAVALNEELTTVRTELETEISNRQTLILVLKAELLAGLEDYKQLANDYAMKMDLYNDKLSRYRNLYGELGDEEEY